MGRLAVALALLLTLGVVAGMTALLEWDRVTGARVYVPVTVAELPMGGVRVEPQAFFLDAVRQAEAMAEADTDDPDRDGFVVLEVDAAGRLRDARAVAPPVPEGRLHVRVPPNSWTLGLASTWATPADGPDAIGFVETRITPEGRIYLEGPAGEDLRAP